MKRLVLYQIVLFFFFGMAIAHSQGREKYTPKDKSPEEIIMYIKKAVAFVKEEGKGAYNELTDPNGPWVNGDWYIYVNNFKGFIEAHLNRKLVGKNFYGVRDVKGNPFFAQLQEIAYSEKGHGWVEFWWPKPNSVEPVLKIGYVMRVPGRNIWVGTGVYDMKQEDIDKILTKQEEN